MKKLITEKVIEELIKNNEKQIVIDDDTLITPAAKDMASNAGIQFVCADEQICRASECCETEQAEFIKENESSEKMELTRETIARAVLEVLNEQGLLK